MTDRRRDNGGNLFRSIEATRLRHQRVPPEHSQVCDRLRVRRQPHPFYVRKIRRYMYLLYPPRRRLRQFTVYLHRQIALSINPHAPIHQVALLVLRLQSKDVETARRFLADTLEGEVVILPREGGRSARIAQLRFAFKDPLHRRDPAIIASRAVHYES